MAGLADRQHL